MLSHGKPLFFSEMRKRTHKQVKIRRTRETGHMIKVLCEQTRELTDDLHNFLDYVLGYLT